MILSNVTSGENIFYQQWEMADIIAKCGIEDVKKPINYVPRVLTIESDHIDFSEKSL